MTRTGRTKARERRMWSRPAAHEPLSGNATMACVAGANLSHTHPRRNPRRSWQSKLDIAQHASNPRQQDRSVHLVIRQGDKREIAGLGEDGQISADACRAFALDGLCAF